METLYKIKNGAVFISDSHDGLNRGHFREFLESIPSEDPPQIFLLGDMFDFLANTDYVGEFYAKEIALIDEISKKTEIFYFEGNHDYNLSEIFKFCKVFDNASQPVKFSDDFGNTLQIAHGDIFLPKFTKFILLFLRGKMFLKIMNFIDNLLNFQISKMILKSQKDKILYKKMENFKEFAEKRAQNYSADIVIEGHFHQDESFVFGGKKYINLNSYAVKQKIYIYENGNLKPVNRQNQL